MRVGVWDRDTIAWLIVAASLPPAAIAVLDQGIGAVVRIVVCLAVIWGWQAVFLFARAQPVSPIAIVTAVAVAILAPGEMALWQIVLAVSFGTVMGEQIFGGWGRNIVNAAVATLAFIFFAFPETLHEGTGGEMAFACLPALLILAVLGILSWQVLAAAVAGAVGATLLLGGDPLVLPLQGSLVFGLVFLVCDPVASAATRTGRWFYGLLAGGLAALFGWADAGIGAPQAIVLAALLASLFAPLIDSAVIAGGSAIRRRRNG